MVSASNKLGRERELTDIASDRATPFANTIGVISPRWGNPFAATVACLGITTILGLIYLGSAVVSISCDSLTCLY